MSNDIVIIGAGAAGLSLAYHLLQSGLSVTLLEKGKSAATTWSSMPDHLKLISTWRCNSLLKEQPSKYDRSFRMPAKEYAEYLKKFSQEHGFKIQTETEVTSLTRTNQQFNIQTNKGELSASKVIVSTGYFDNPFIPESLKQSEIPLIPFSQFKNAQEFKDQGFQKILIVGKRLSAGQAVFECVQAGLETHLSSRTQVAFMAPPFIFNFSFKYLYELESIPLAFKPRLNLKPDIKMESGRIKDLFDQNLVKTHTDIQSLNGKKVIFADGHTESFDALLLATGFRPSFKKISGIPEFETSQLRNQFEHPTLDHLYFLGIHEQFNYRSRFLRGMREDALRLARNLIADSSS